MTPFDALLQAPLPAMLVAIAMLAGSLLLRPKEAGRPEEPRRTPGLLGRLLPPALFALAFWSGDIALNQWHELWPKDGTNRFLAVAVAAGCCGMGHAAAGSALLTALVRLALGATIALALLTPVPERYMPRPLLITLVGLAPVWLAGVGAALDRADRHLPRIAVPSALTAAACAAAPGLFLSGYAGGARLLGTLCAIAGGLLLASAVRARAWTRLDGAYTVWLSILLAVLLVAYGYNDVPAWWTLPVMAVAPLGALAGLPARPAWAKVAAALGASAIISGAATLGALAAATPHDDGSYYGD